MKSEKITLPRSNASSARLKGTGRAQDDMQRRMDEKLILMANKSGELGSLCDLKVPVGSVRPATRNDVEK